MHTETRTTDAKGRLVLPKSFANATVIIEQLSDMEIRVRRAKVVPEDELPFAEETPTVLSDRDRFLDLLAKPPAPERGVESRGLSPQGPPWLIGSSNHWRSIQCIFSCPTPRSKSGSQ